MVPWSDTFCTPADEGRGCVICMYDIAVNSLVSLSLLIALVQGPLVVIDSKMFHKESFESFV